ncbi:MAG: tRNA pseudouridine(38-40) synthase TruA [Syntrophaceticus sp.]|jgi:tRNA pseudouridine38-40 synthase|nr:tRNA pseudouridine(38-40) synthase TruA [Syntrophaceticus sp.]MDD3314125.1 tRNA pseudouridine(38-40) synthase TruA [Syntrophaceticus sp.]MDD4360233.1 tRNA pseudouridine(38-40) synthase TruA [Syntrophaceticus sp.]MDD4782188.1 tRNA pseudouridine(38-40) synthase TruA [Syntrophaceticus sp.]
MRRLKVTLEYDGTEFAGFQKQTGTKQRTVQGVLEESLFRLTGEKIAAIGAGRTDSGVHAYGQVVHFETGSTIPVERFCEALTGQLPPDIAAVDATVVDPSFHARYSAVAKKYCYLVFNSRKPIALWRNYCYRYPFPLNISAAKECAEVFIGEHDFRAFSASGSSERSTVRHLYSVDTEQQGDLVKLTVVGSGFLYKMMRLIVGTLLEVGSGKLSIEQVRQILNTGERGKGGATAPPQGLYLVKVFYNSWDLP